MKRFVQILAAGAALLAASGAAAVTVEQCDWRARADAIVEPWADYSRTFSNGKTRLALLDVIEPAAGALHILVMSPPYDEMGGRQCKVISAASGIGFFGVEFTALDASYNPAIGLMFMVPVQVYDGSTGMGRGAWLNFNLNQATGQIDAWLVGGE
ncbi:MAG: hypothetical protein K8F59_01495 [Rhodobacteraceae bacterium]|nr:hypothetical protein [Paracoccaceae bacterium]